MSVTSDPPANAFREFTAADRRRLAEKGWALEDGGYPIETVEDLRNAIQSVGRAKDSDEAKAHIKKRAAELGQEDLIPEEWAADIAFRANFSATELALGEWAVQRFRAPDYIGMTDEPGKNWLEEPQVGGLPSYIRRIANHLIGKGMAEGHAIASAVNTVKRWARGGRVSEHGGGERGAAHVKPDTIAKAIVALAEWEIKKAAAKAHASQVRTFAAATADEVDEAEKALPPEDDGDTMGALREGFEYLTGWIADEDNADDPAFDVVKAALDKVGPQLSELGSGSTTASAIPTTETADSPAPVDGGVDDPGLNVPLKGVKAEYDALLASADSIVEELTSEYVAAVAALE